MALLENTLDGSGSIILASISTAAVAAVDIGGSKALGR